MKKLNQCFVVLFFLVMVYPITAQVVPVGSVVDPTFDAFIRSAPEIKSAAEQKSDGKVIFASRNVLLVNGQQRYLFRLNDDGSFDNSFDVETDDGVSTVAVQDNGKIIIGGYFTMVNGNAANYLARLNSDGSFDGSFNMGSGPDAEVLDLLVDGNDRILISGQFMTYDGTSAPYFTRLNSNGSLNNSFNTNLGSGPDNVLTAIGLQSTGDIIVAGMVSDFNGMTAYGIIRLSSDGTRDSFFDSNVGLGTFGPQILEIGIDPNDNSIILGGSFTIWDSSNFPNNILKLDADGVYDATFVSNVGAGPAYMGSSAFIRTAIRVRSNGKILVAGQFDEWDSNTANFLPSWIPMEVLPTRDSTPISGRDRMLNFLASRCRPMERSGYWEDTIFLTGRHSERL